MAEKRPRAVALQYDPTQRTAAPRVLARGQGELRSAS